MAKRTFVQHANMTQKQAFEILKAGHNVYLTGAAGAGKTHLLNDFIGFLKSKGIGVGVTASTGIAATHIGGLTIHSWAGIGIKRDMSDEDCRLAAGNRRVAKRFGKTKVLIIDEISMLDADRLNLVDRVARFATGIKKPFGDLQVVFCGDFFQLPPVSRRDSYSSGDIATQNEAPPQFAYKSLSWQEANTKICYLAERFRHDDREFLSVLEAIRGATVNESTTAVLKTRLHAKLASDRATKLYSHNADVDAENTKELARLGGKETKYRMDSNGVPAIVEALKRGCLAPEELTLKKGAAVMFVKNNFEEGYVNGTLGVVLENDDDGWPVVSITSGRKIIVHPAKWTVEENGKILAEITQVPLRLAWAITVHKSQGMTLDAAEIDLSDAFEAGMGYVALSRVRTLSGIRLLGINETALTVHPEVLEFDKELRKQSEAAEREFSYLFKAAKNGGEASVKEASAKEDRMKKDKSADGSAEGGAKAYSVESVREKHPLAYERWSDEEERRLAENFSKGVSVAELAVEFGRKSGGIRARLKKLGLIA